jgi:hypothetical protein
VPKGYLCGAYRGIYGVPKGYLWDTLGVLMEYLLCYLCSTYTEKKVENDKSSIRVYNS